MMQMVSSSYVGLYQFHNPIQRLRSITDAEGWIVTNEQMETSIHGIFAVGDIRQNTTSNHNNCWGWRTSSHMVYNYVEEVKEN